MKVFVVFFHFYVCVFLPCLFFFFLQVCIGQENPGWKWCVRATADSEPFPANGAVSEVVEYSGGWRGSGRIMLSCRSYCPYLCTNLTLWGEGSRLAHYLTGPAAHRSSAGQRDG